ncbi:nitroreductase family deazaflavin-dependent oxidoreductase [Mycolicibacterium sp.]|uniref:nitroreductase family deazaflavin-dependent oxidoreductase n=1 Tax=Mycolicibacterium sp. TaxID=2320850 RepID=UPI0025DD7D0A|nr:nitroreductase family deazaflavin-dependent oxidoreductase [Mycolicibacterium sp.]MCB9409605.1 nitroreductase family deazaflavin-dependent oxidoreductase [Mycolicibacterium sp.]
MTGSAFPHSRWGSDSGPLRKVVDGFAATPLGSRFIRALVPLDRRVLKATKGRYTALGPLGLQILVLTTIGRKSGQRRESPLLYTRDGDRLYLFGSNFGQSTHPAWSSNLLANPDAWVTMGGKEIPVRARQLSGDEYDRADARFMTYLKAYPAYRTRTDRDIRIFELAPR